MSNYYKVFCKECERGSEISLDALENKMPEYAPISLRNINEIVNKFKCSICQSKNFTLSGSNEVVIFDMSSLVLCLSCELPIPNPRLKAQTKTHLCITCVEEGEIAYSEKERLGRIFPEVPIDMKGKCPLCVKKGRKGFVVVRFNSNNEDFFLGCDLYPKCFWSKSFDYDLES